MDGEEALIFLEDGVTIMAFHSILSFPSLIPQKRLNRGRGSDSLATDSRAPREWELAFSFYSGSYKSENVWDV